MAQKNKNAAWADCCENWGDYMAAKKAKLEEQFQDAAKNEFSNPSTLFNGVAIFVNGYTNPSADELKRIMMANGGIYHHYLRPQSTTHMIASNLPYSKIVAYKKAQNPMPLCKPEWITDSIKTGKLLDFRKYLLYSHCTKTQPTVFAQILKQDESQTDNTPVKSNTCFKNSTHINGSELEATQKKSELKLQAASNSEITSVTSNCTKNPDFLTEFYNNSRLHHIATMGAMFKDYINDLRDKSDGKFPGLEILKMQSYSGHCKAAPSNKNDDSESDDNLLNDNQYLLQADSVIETSSKKNPVIMHIDMDCFFVSVGLRNHPELIGFPIAVTHAKGNKQNISNDSDDYGSMSEVASCSYEARKAGVKNGMLLGQALKLCPNLKTIRYDFDGYKEVSYILYDTVASYTLDIEAVSCDEMYADCTKILQTCRLSPLEFATIIRNEIKNKTGCPVSTGFGLNKLQARLATKKAKPDGQCYLKADDIKSFIRTLNVRDLPGVGYSTSHKLYQMNVKTCADLEAISLYELQKEFGKKTGQQLYDMCRGIDHSKLNLEHTRKSISAEVNYGIRFESHNAAHDFLKKLSIEISDRLKKINSKGKCITLKVLFRAKEAPNEPKKFMGHGICDAYNKSKNLIAATDDPITITREVLTLWNKFHQNPEDARGIGIHISKLESSKSKSNGLTLLKFINNMKETERNIVESNTFINTNILLEQSKSTIEENQYKTNSCNLNGLEKEINSIDKTSNLQDKNITLSLKNNFLSEEMDLNNQHSSDKKQEENIKSVVEQCSKNSSRLKQTTQSEYFKKIKPSSSNKINKIKIPDLQELDMKVLIELPVDIRNEIFEEYKKSNDSESSSSSERENSVKIINKNLSNTNNKLEKDLSFSQIDPEFLAALPDEVKNEVKSYCDARKKEKNIKKEEKQANNIANRGWDMFKNEKKQKSVKIKPGKLKIIKSIKKDTKNNNIMSNNKINKDDEIIKSRSKIQNPVKTAHVKITKDTSDMNKISYFENLKGNSEHSEILTSLVNCLLDLSISQVKLQIRQWIHNNDDVNDVDFLSFTTYLGTLPKKKRIEDLHILLKCLYRCIAESQSCSWHETYKKMLKHIQTRMRQEYGYDLMIPDQIKCHKCKNSEM